MPVERTKRSDLTSPRRASKITRLPEWKETVTILTHGPFASKEDALKITFGSEAKKLYGDEKKAALAFYLRLRNDYRGKFKMRLVGKSEVQIFNLDKDKNKA